MKALCIAKKKSVRILSCSLMWVRRSCKWCRLIHACTSHYNIDQSNWVYHTYILWSKFFAFLLYSSFNILSAQLISCLYRLDSSFTLAIRRENEIQKKRTERFDVGQLLLSHFYIHKLQIVI